MEARKFPLCTLFSLDWYGEYGNVAIALTVGGPGAIFWMWFAAVLGGASAFVESTLAQFFKVKTDVGFKGGPATFASIIKSAFGIEQIPEVELVQPL